MTYSNRNVNRTDKHGSNWWCWVLCKYAWVCIPDHTLRCARILTLSFYNARYYLPQGGEFPCKCFNFSFGRKTN